MNFVKFSFTKRFSNFWLLSLFLQKTTKQLPPQDLGEKSKEIVLHPPQYDVIFADVPPYKPAGRPADDKVPILPNLELSPPWQNQI